MTLLAEYREARREEDVARLRRALALRAMRVSGMTQREIADALGVSQSAVSQQIATTPNLDMIHPAALIEAAGPILTRIAEGRGFTRLAVFGSVARGQASLDSDVDLLVEAPPGTSIRDLLALRDRLASVIGRPVDLVTYSGLKPDLDDDIRREAVLL